MSNPLPETGTRQGHVEGGQHVPQARAPMPGPGDGGTSILNRQDPGWSSALRDKKGASKRLFKRLKRRLTGCDVVQKIRQVAHPHSRSPSSSHTASHDCGSDDSGNDGEDEFHRNLIGDDDEFLNRLPSQRLHAGNVEVPTGFVVAVPGDSTDFCGRALVVQVIMARELPASDFNGSSDPYCVVHCNSEEASTAIVYQCLTPRWNETFVFTEAKAEEHQRKRQVHIEVKDYNKHLSDDTLGKVDVTLEDFVVGPSPKWVDLNPPLHDTGDDRSPGNRGQLCLSMWLGPRVVEQPPGGLLEPKPVVSTMTAPVGSCRMLPTVVHSGSHCMYEEPTHVYLKIGLRKLVVQDAAMLRSTQQREAYEAGQERHRDVESEQQHAACPEDSELRPESHTDAYDRMDRPSDAHPSFYADEEASESEQSLAPESSDEPPSEDEVCVGISSESVTVGVTGDPFQDNSDDNEKRGDKDSGGSDRRTKDDAGNEKSRPDETWLFMKVTMADQTRKTKLLLMNGDSVLWRTSFVFPATAPLRQQSLRLRLFRAAANKARGRLVATAVIPLVDLINRTTDLAVPGVPASEASVEGRRWFQLHAVSHGRRPAMGQAQLTFAACDADGRRQLYRQPLLDLQEPSTEGAKHSSLLSAEDSFSVVNDLRVRRQEMSFDQRTPSVTSEPLGVLSVTLHHLELAEEAHSFCVVTCGPHWGLTAITPHSDHPCFNWQMHFPVHDPYTLFQLGVFKSGKPGQITAIKRHIPFIKDKPLLLGKLRVRLNTMLPGRSYSVALPMLAGRRNGGERTCTAHLTMKVRYQSVRALLGSYIEPQLPPAAYEWGIAQGADGKTTNDHQRKMVHDWLEAQQPSLPADVSMVMADDARDEFSLPRAHINFRRCQEALNGLSRFKNLIREAKTWRNPVLSTAVIFMAALMCYQTTLFAVLMVGALLVHQLRRQDPSKEYPLPMDDDPTGLKADGKEEQDTRDKHLPFKIRAKSKYDHLVGVGLRMQNGFEDFAGLFERVQAAFSWKDPIASAVMLEVTVALGIVIIILGFPTTLFLAICIQLRHPKLRSPTIPLPLRFYLRLPTRSDEIM